MSHDAAATGQVMEEEQELSKLVDGIMNVLNDADADPVMALGSCHCATVSTLDQHFSAGAGDRYMKLMTAFMEAELGKYMATEKHPVANLPIDPELAAKA